MRPGYTPATMAVACPAPHAKRVRVGGAVPAPSVCQTCQGDGVVLSLSCPDCRCGVCGRATDTPPECKDCACAEEAAAKRRDDR